MHYLQEKKTVAMAPASFTNGATAALVVDTLGFASASIDVIFSASNNTTNVPTVLKVATGEITSATGFTDITGGSFTSTYTTANTVVTNADVLTFDLALTGNRSRYLKISASPVTTQVVAIVANLGRGAITPSTAASKNVAGWLTL